MIFFPIKKKKKHNHCVVWCRVYTPNLVLFLLSLIIKNISSQKLG